MDKSKLYSVSELAREFSLTAQALRFYEERGLLSPARSGRTRVYTYRDRARLTLIQRLRHLGFSLDDIVEYLSLYRIDGGSLQFRVGLGKIRRRLEELYGLRQEIDKTVEELHALEKEALAKLAEAEEAGEGNEPASEGGAE